MRVLLDENLPVDLATELVGHEVATVTGLAWEGIRNSELLRRAEGRFEVFVTMDRNLEFEQNISVLDLGVVLIRAPSNRMIHLRPLLSFILEALEEVQPGELRRVGA
ncbi:MAG TPA: DUF5615 family PIN-like protein [Acidobacteriota bacterium]|nr:DUF5615 family PIN-like protein [Acidobacteriota bacterium]